jgi:hypothetical protein
MGSDATLDKFQHLPGDIHDRSAKISEFPEEIIG